MHPMYSYTVGIIFLSIYIASFYAYNKTDLLQYPSHG